jgi:hypothetical protein
MKDIKIVSSTLLATLLACSGSNDGSVEVEDNALHIARVSVERTNNGALVTMRGFDIDDHEVGFASLRIGEVKYSYDPGVAPDEASVGSELVVSVGEDRTTVVTPDLQRHVQGPFDKRSLTGFVTLDPVRAELATAGIELSTEPTFGTPVEQGETAYTYYMEGQNCNARLFPSSMGQCAQSTSSTMRTISSQYYPDQTHTIIFRFYIGAVCRKSDGSTGCGPGNPCAYGPCGGYNNYESFGYVEKSNGTNVSVESNYNWPFWDPISNQCTCTGCNTDGTATPAGCTKAF